MSSLVETWSSSSAIFTSLCTVCLLNYITHNAHNFHFIISITYLRTTEYFYLLLNFCFRSISLSLKNLFGAICIHRVWQKQNGHNPWQVVVSSFPTQKKWLQRWKLLLLIFPEGSLVFNEREGLLHFEQLICSWRTTSQGKPLWPF